MTSDRQRRRPRDETTGRHVNKSTGSEEVRGFRAIAFTNQFECILRTVALTTTMESDARHARFRCSSVKSVGRCDELPTAPKAITPFDRSVIGSAGSRLGPRRRRFELKSPFVFDVPARSHTACPITYWARRHRRLEGALITKVSQRCHPPTVSRVSVTTIAPWGTRGSLRQRRSCAAEAVGKRPMSPTSLNRRRKQGGAFIRQRGWQTAGRD